MKGLYPDVCLIETISSKTLIVKDGDPLLTSPNLIKILSELREIYDRHYDKPIIVTHAE